jgi:hypothetical protein
MLERYRYFGPIAFNRRRPKLTRPYFKFDPALFEDYEMGWQTVKQSDSEPESQDSFQNADDLKNPSKLSADLVEEGPA